MPIAFDSDRVGVVATYPAAHDLTISTLEGKPVAFAASLVAAAASPRRLRDRRKKGSSKERLRGSRRSRCLVEVGKIVVSEEVLIRDVCARRAEASSLDCTRRKVMSLRCRAGDAHGEGLRWCSLSHACEPW